MLLKIVVPFFLFLYTVVYCANAVEITAEMREQGLKDGVDAYGFPRMKIFSMISPAHLVTMNTLYTKAVTPGAFHYFTAEDIEVIYAAVSAINNCEMCLSFHAMTMGGHGVSAEHIKAIVAGGVPSDSRLAALVTGAKYATAHKGIFLEREKKHLAILGIEGEKLSELNFLVALMTAFNQNYVHLISEGAELEEMLHPHGPFVDTVYKSEKDL